jgi:hypothetical protein
MMESQNMGVLQDTESKEKKHYPKQLNTADSI